MLFFEDVWLEAILGKSKFLLVFNSVFCLEIMRLSLNNYLNSTISFSLSLSGFPFLFIKSLKVTEQSDLSEGSNALSIFVSSSFVIDYWEPICFKADKESINIILSSNF